MKVLYVCHRFPYPPKRGGKIRPFNMIKHLSGNHDVTVASLTRSQEELEAARGIAPYCDRYLVEKVWGPAAHARMLARLPTRVPSSMGYFYSPRLAARIRAALAKCRYDLIFVHCSSAAQYVAHVAGTPKILDFGDMDSQKWLTYTAYRRFPMAAGYWLEGRKLMREEVRLARRFDYCTCTTRAELETLRSYPATTESDWFPNGVDLDYFSPEHRTYNPNEICFVGRMDYFPNQQGVLQFCRDIWPQITAQRPQTQLTVVGANPSPEIRRLASHAGITVTGTVDDVRPYVHRCAVNIAPLRIARGTQNKILESMAMGVPVVATATAAGGIDAVAGEHFVQANDDKQFADATLRLLNNSDVRQRLSVNARARMESHHCWAASMMRLDAIIERTLDSFRARQQAA